MMTIAELRELEDQAKKQAAQALYFARMVVIPQCGASLSEFPVPMNATHNAVYAGGESFGRRHAITKYPEAGRWMATCKKGLDDEVGVFGFNPFDTRSSVWGVQKSWESARACAERGLRKAGYRPFSSHSDADMRMLMFLVRSVGTGCLRRMLTKARKFWPKEAVGTGLYTLVRAPDVALQAGQQTDEIVRLRVFRAYYQSSFDVELPGEVVDLTAPAPKRPDDIVPPPAGIYTNLKQLSAIARRQGPRPTGLWPGSK